MKRLFMYPAAVSKLLAVAAVAVLGVVPAGHTASITLELIDSYERASPFGLAFDGNNVWWSDNSGNLTEMTTSGVDTGNSFNTGIWSELAWDGSTILQARGSTIYYWNKDGSSAGEGTVDFAVNGGRGCGGLVDGLDHDQGEVWCSPDVSVVYRMTDDLQNPIGEQPVIGGAGGYSGVERIQATNGTDYIVVVNDAFVPRQLCVHSMDYAELGCQQFENSRYEGLAFDGRYIYAADYFGNAIDKYDILSDGGSIIDPDDLAPIPLPATGVLLVGALGGLASLRRRGLG